MEEFLYKKLDISKQAAAEVQLELIRYVNNHVTISMTNAFDMLDTVHVFTHCYKLRSIIKELKLQPAVVGLVRSFPKQIAGNPHIDSGPQSLAINFPVQDCSNSTTNFYKPIGIDSEPVMVSKKHPNGTEYFHYENVTWKLLDSYCLDTPVLLNVHVPHKVDHYGELNRLAISIRFNEDPWFLTIP
jgi:hypothetical protein